MQRSGRDESRTPCISIRDYTRYVLRICNIAVGIDDTVTGYGSRKRGTRAPG